MFVNEVDIYFVVIAAAAVACGYFLLLLLTHSYCIKFYILFCVDIDVCRHFLWGVKIVMQKGVFQQINIKKKNETCTKK